MPQAVQADWNLIRDLYSKGMTCTEIAKETGVQSGTIASRASRGQWKAVATKANSIVQVEIQGSKAESHSGEITGLAKHSAKARQSLSDELLRAVDTLTATKHSKRLETQGKRASVVQTLASAAKTVYGWSESSAQPLIRMNVLGSIQVQSETLPESQTQPVIDVESVTDLPKTT